MLSRYEDVANLTPWERDLLKDQGLGPELEPTRTRQPKVSARAKVALLLWERGYREWVVKRIGPQAEDQPFDPEADRPEDYLPSIPHGLLLAWHEDEVDGLKLVRGEYEAAALFTSKLSAGEAWRAVREKHPGDYKRLSREFSQAVEPRDVVDGEAYGLDLSDEESAEATRIRRKRIALGGEAKHAQERFKRLRDELGVFEPGPAAEAKVRKWIELGRLRQSRGSTL